jgi:hypothetical protein
MNYLRQHFPSYFGAPKASDIDAKALATAQSHLAQLLTDRDLLQGQIAGYTAIIARLSKPTAEHIEWPIVS